jgi:hypothetical protein
VCVLVRWFGVTDKTGPAHDPGKLGFHPSRLIWLEIFPPGQAQDAAKNGRRVLTHLTARSEGARLVRMVWSTAARR